MIRQAALHRTHRSNTRTVEHSRMRHGYLRARRQRDRRGLAWFVRGVLLISLIVAVSGCSTLHVPAARPSFSAKESAEAQQEGVLLKAMAILGKESYSDLFDDYLPQFGIIAVWMTIENRGKQEVTVDPKHWYLMAASRRCPAMSPNEMVDRYYRERGIHLYFVHADERARDRLAKLSLRGGRIAPSDSIEGFVFFRIDGPAPPSWNLDATLMARGIKPGGRRELDMQLPLHAHP